MKRSGHAARKGLPGVGVLAIVVISGVLSASGAHAQADGDPVTTRGGDRCDCDDPGLVGAIIGAPVGALIGGIVGFKLFQGVA